MYEVIVIYLNKKDQFWKSSRDLPYLESVCIHTYKFDTLFHFPPFSPDPGKSPSTLP